MSSFLYFSYSYYMGLTPSAVIFKFDTNICCIIYRAWSLGLAVADERLLCLWAELGLLVALWLGDGDGRICQGSTGFVLIFRFVIYCIGFIYVRYFNQENGKINEHAMSEWQNLINNAGKNKINCNNVSIFIKNNKISSIKQMMNNLNS